MTRKMRKSDSTLVEELKASAESIIKNADSIIGSEPYKRDIYVAITLKHDESPNISVEKNIVPERIINSI